MADQSRRRDDAVAIDRRGFIITASGIAASWALPIRAIAQDGVPPPDRRTLPVFTVPEGWSVPFGEPEVVAAVDGTAGQDLAVRFAEISILEPDDDGVAIERIELTRTYNGKVPGPTFRLKPGDKLAFKITNELPHNEPAPPPYNEIDDCHMLMALNVPGCFNTTNLHTHGLHASPQTQGDLMTGVSSDDVRIRIPPKDDPMDDDGWPSERQYCVWLPEFHAPGTHWYHAHVHGSTAIQLVNGLAGALIVEEPEDQKILVDAGADLDPAGDRRRQVIGGLRQYQGAGGPAGRRREALWRHAADHALHGQLADVLDHRDAAQRDRSAGASSTPRRPRAGS